MHTVVIAINVADDGTDLEGLLTAIEARPAVLSCCDITTFDQTTAGDEHMVLVTVPSIEKDDEDQTPPRCDSTLSQMRCELPAGHGRYHKNGTAGWDRP